MKYLLLLAALLLAPLPAEAQSVLNYYAGYLATADAPYTSISGMFQIPAEVAPVGGSGGATNMCLNVGVSTNNIIQNCVQMSTDGVATYGLLCFSEDPIHGVGDCAGSPSAPVPSANDIMVLTITCTSNCTANTATTVWTLNVQDITAAWRYTYLPQTIQNDLSTVFWMGAENTQTAGVGTSNYGQVTWLGMTVNGAKIPTLSQSTNGRKYLDPQNFTSFPSPIVGNSFSVCWGSGSVYTTGCTSSGAIGPFPLAQGNGGFIGLH